METAIMKALAQAMGGDESGMMAIPMSQMPGLERLKSSPSTAERTEPSTKAGKLKAASASLAADVIESESDFTVVCEVPGVAKDKIEITIEKDGVLLVKADKPKREFAEGSTHEYRSAELKHGEAFRRVRLPSTVDQDTAQSTLVDGVLTIVFQKAPVPPAKKIMIN